MNNPFEQLEQQIIDLKNKILSLDSKVSGEKRWLSTAELSMYIPYSKETINKKVQSGEFEHGVHFYQQAKMRMFDKLKIDEWIMSNKLSTHNELKKQEILSKIQNDF